MKRIALIIEYDGTDYSGWQRQNNAPTIQEEIEKAIFLSIGEQISIAGAGRTDAGVHAFHQVAHFDSETTIPADRFKFVLNQKLPEDIRIKDSFEVSENFHSRKTAKKKHYRYVIYNDSTANAVGARYSYFVTSKLNVENMKRAAKKIEGTHDFNAFKAEGSTVQNSTVRTVYSLTVEQSGKYIIIDVTGNGFLYNMVRIIVGTLLNVGKGQFSVDDIDRIIESKNRINAGPTVPAKGLILYDIEYEKID